MEIQSLASEIEKAFPKWNPESETFHPKDLTLEELNILREAIWDSSRTEIPAYLGVVLAGSLFRIPADSTEFSAHTMFIRFLDAGFDQVASDSTDRTFERNFGRKVPANDYAAIQARQAEKFAEVTPEQAELVVMWIDEVYRWKASEPVHRELLSAKRFWREKATQ